MNDAVESFLVLKNCRMTGEYLADYEGKIETELREYERTETCEIRKQGSETILKKINISLMVHQGDSVCTSDCLPDLEEEVSPV